MDTTHRLLNLATDAALAAGKKIIEIYNQDDFNVRLKSDDSPLTDADLKSHDSIVEHLSQEGYPILSEEGKEMPYSERAHWNKLWIVDPLDGTKEFVKRNGEFTVNIAFIDNGFPSLGVVFAPWLGQLYYGSSEGAFYVDLGRDWLANNKQASTRKTIALPVDLPEKYTVVASKSHFSEDTKTYIDQLATQVGEIDFTSVGSSLKMCLVAAGKAHLYPRFGPTMEWDTAAGQAVLEAAGGQLIDMQTNKRMCYNREQLLNNFFFAIAKGVNAKNHLLL